MIIDTNSNCLEVTSWLVQRGVEVVGRYYAASAGSKVIKKAEAQALSAKGIEIFVVYEDVGAADQFKLTAEEGGKNGSTARTQAVAIGQPKGGVIYFAVEGLPHGYRQEDLPGVRDYFAGVKTGLGNDYAAGVYGDGIVCRALLSEGICTHTWLAQASWSFQGSQEFYASKKWNLAQIVTDLPKKNWNGLSVDINEGRGDLGSFLVSTA